MTEQPTPADRPPPARQPVFWLAIVAALLAIVVALLVGMLIGSETSVAPTPSPTAIDPATPAEP